MSSSLPSATVAVEKATSDLLIGPDWTMNIDICDSINSNHWLAKDVVKAVKRRLQHKNAQVQLLALTLLETMVKNCGDYVHFQIAEKNVLGEMVKIVKKVDMQVRDKILALLDSWQEAFGGPGGKYPQYYWAYDELRLSIFAFKGQLCSLTMSPAKVWRMYYLHSGIEFPRRSLDAAPIRTPPASHPTSRFAHAGHGMPSGSSRRLDETMATEIESLTLSSLESMRNVMDLLNDMLQAVNPSDSVAVKDEVIVDLVNRCQSNQKKLMQMLTTTGDEELLASGLELNDSLQSLLAKHDAIASGSILHTQATNLSSKPIEVRTNNLKPAEIRDSSPRPSCNPPAPVATRSQIDEDDEEDDEEEDDFAQLARRHSKTQPMPPQTKSAENSEGPVSMDMPAASDPVPCNAIVLSDPPVPVRTTKEQDMIDLLAITLTTTSTTQDTPEPQSAFNQNMHQVRTSTSAQGHPHASQSYPGSQGQVPFNGYVVPWAQPQPQKQSQPELHSQSQSHQLPQSQSQLHAQSRSPLHQRSQSQLQPQSQPQLQSQLQPQIQPQFRPQYSQYSSAYPPPPWVASPDDSSSQRNMSIGSNMFWTPKADTYPSYTPMQVPRPLQHYNSFPVRGSNGSAAIGGDTWIASGTRSPATVAGQKPFIPSYRLFEDLNVLGNADGRHKVTSSTSPSLSRTPGQSMIGGRK